MISLSLNVTGIEFYAGHSSEKAAKYRLKLHFFQTFNLDSLVGRARVGCWRRVWVGATTRKAPAFKEEQHPQARCQRRNRVCSAATQMVNLIKAQRVNMNTDLREEKSGQLRNLGSMIMIDLVGPH